MSRRRDSELDCERNDCAWRDDPLSGDCNKRSENDCEHTRSQASRAAKQRRRTLELGVNDRRDGPVLRDLKHILLVPLRPSRQQLLNLPSSKFAELRHGLDACFPHGFDDLAGDVRELKKRGGGRVNSLKEELLEMEDRDETREPVVRKDNRGEASAKGKGDGDGCVLLFRRDRKGVRKVPHRFAGVERAIPRRRAAFLMGSRNRCAAMSTLALFCELGQVEYPSHPFLPSTPSRTVEVNLAYSSTPSLPSDLRILSRVGSVANSSDAARMSSRTGKVVSSLSARK